jgi:hypothetical protein
MLRLPFALILVAPLVIQVYAPPADAAAAGAAPAADPAGPRCPALEFRQFDFWVGDWDTFETDKSTPDSIARARVEPIAAGCAIRELYEQTDGLIGDSILSYDAVKKAWQQTWVTNRGSFMYLTGVFKDGAVTLEGESHLRDGKTVNMRITWKADGPNVREYAVSSTDGGKKWEPAFDVTFKRKSASK